MNHHLILLKQEVKLQAAKQTQQAVSYLQMQQQQLQAIQQQVQVLQQCSVMWHYTLSDSAV